MVSGLRQHQGLPFENSPLNTLKPDDKGQRGERTDGRRRADYDDGAPKEQQVDSGNGAGYKAPGTEVPNL